MIVLPKVRLDGDKVTEVQGLEQVIPVLRRFGPSKTPKVLLLTVPELSGLENMSVMIVFRPWPVALFAGVMDVTTGEVVSAVFAVVKLKFPPLALLPA